jgi:hypothetical protein
MKYVYYLDYGGFIVYYKSEGSNTPNLDDADFFNERQEDLIDIGWAEKVLEFLPFNEQ